MILIEKRLLDANADKISKALPEQFGGVSLELRENKVYGRAIQNFLLFTDAEKVRSSLGVELSRKDMFYNRYYWFNTFMRLKFKTDGFDAGLEQQSSALIENFDDEIDWKMVEVIENQVQSEVQ